ncbi:major facilitator superfamily transporter [Microdochium trichocladiopsis]|uniref:Major facilitator superfamily transporter n=1 Tax=Microdochium trichocladiopsis TaxID=1682393 RepID=A0A9P8XWU5_9PEZI|nr:major facilitator superfamily transporter [Microdochium trichocladiopsis]KAH7021366.1 major facilitator superfamily transporter [Microdochium trichocladiopsis]
MTGSPTDTALSASDEKAKNHDLVVAADHEGRHVVVDAEAAHEYIIDPAAESRLVRKLDLRVLPMVFLMYFFTFLDRTNLGNAKGAGLEADLGLGTYGFNIGACLYYIVYFFADIPAALSVKKFGFIMLPLSCILFGIVTLGTAFIHNAPGFYVVRVLLGLTESFQFPGLSYVISRYYRRSEVTTRVSFFMLAAAGLAGGFGGLLASALLALGSIGSVTGWRNIFLVEGTDNDPRRIITIGVGIISLYLFPADPSRTRIFSEEERALAMARMFHDQPAIVEHKERITWPLIKRGFFNVNVMVGAWIYICDQITVQGLSIFTVTILKLNYPGRSTVEIQLLSVPPPIFGALFGLAVAYVTMKTQKHGIAIACCAAVNVIGYSIWIASTNAQARYAAIFLNTAGGFSWGTLILSWTLANAAPDTVRNVANGAVSGLANIGSIAATWSYVSTDAGSGYRIGNSLNVATGASVIVAALALVMYQKLENRKREGGGRDYRLQGPAHKIAKLGHLHPEYRYIH